MAKIIWASKFLGRVHYGTIYLEITLNRHTPCQDLNYMFAKVSPSSFSVSLGITNMMLPVILAIHRGLCTINHYRVRGLKFS